MSAYLDHTGGDKAAAASLALAAVLVEGGRQAPPPVSLTADEAAARVADQPQDALWHVSAAGRAGVYRAGRQATKPAAIRFTLDEIEHFEKETWVAPAKKTAPPFSGIFRHHWPASR